MQDRRLRSILIVGGGTAGWMAAAALAKVLGRECSIRLIESEEIGTVGVGEATVPHLKLFNSVLEIDEVEFIREVRGTFKLGIQFVDWGRAGDRYIHGFGTIGHDYGLLPFHQYWLKLFLAGQATDIGAYSLNTAAAPLGKFMSSAHDVPATSPLANITYAYHFDAGLYALYLRRYAEARGVRRTEGRVVDVRLRGTDGFIEAVVLEGGEQASADLFIDCSGFRGLLIEQALQTGYQDWTHWLPCDRAMAVPCENVGPPTPYTRSTARAAGWQWRIPLQHRTGNGYVYSSAYIEDDAAADTLMSNLDGRPLAEPRKLRFTTGMRRKFWNRNCVAVGLASGFMEPLESPFWQYCSSMEIPAQLADNIRLFRDSGRFFRDAEEMFAITSWVQVMLGQHILPRNYHPAVDLMPERELNELVAGVRSVIASCVEAMPMHAQFLARYGQAARQQP